MGWLRLVAGSAAGGAAGDSVPITLDTSETLFAVFAAMNTCGYDQSLTVSDAMRSNIRAEVQRNLGNSEDATAASVALCDYYQRHRAKDATHDLSQYVSLALYMTPPPQFAPKVKEELMPPDAADLTGFGRCWGSFMTRRGCTRFGRSIAGITRRWPSGIISRWPRWSSTRTFI